MTTHASSSLKHTEAGSISPSNGPTDTVMQENGLKQRRFWLDEMPEDVRENIAKFATDEGEDRPTSLSLAATSELQRLAVLSLLPTCNDSCSSSNLSDQWANLVADHLDRVDINSDNWCNPNSSTGDNDPVLRLLRGKNLNIACIPAKRRFLRAIRNSTSVRDLSLDMLDCSNRSLVCTLRQLGPYLLTLKLKIPRKTSWETQSAIC